MKLYEIISILENAFPPEGAYEWDNVGLLLGDKDADIKKVLLTLDITEAVIAEATDKECDLILSHHPILFSGIKKITTDSSEGRIILSAAKNGICIYSAHTNCDVAPCGTNEHLSWLLSLENAIPLEENGLGRIGTLSTALTLDELASQVKSALGLDFVRVCGDGQKPVKTVAISSGSGADSIPFAIEKGADVMVTGDTKYRVMLDAVRDICIIDAGHYGTEISVCDIFKKLLSDCDIELITSDSRDVYRCI